MLFDIDHVGGAEEIENLRKNISLALDDVRAAVTDWPQMKRGRCRPLAEALPTQNLPFDKATLKEAQNFLNWIANDHFTFFGYREYRVAEEAGDEVLKPVGDSGLGIMRGSGSGMAVRSLRPSPPPISTNPARWAH